MENNSRSIKTTGKGGTSSSGNRKGFRLGSTVAGAYTMRKGSINMEKLLNLKTILIEEFNSLGIEGLNITDLNLLKGSDINLEYTFPNGQRVKLLEDDKMYLGNQVEIEGKDRCFGVAADEKCLLVCEYGCNGSDPEIVFYKRR